MRGESEMKRIKLYRYVGRNGIITSPVLLDDIKHIALMELQPEDGYVLVNGKTVKYNSAVVPVDEVDEWKEVKADTIE